MERGKKIGNKATAYLAQVGREPQPVEPKILLPLVQAASLESDEGLAGKWAALLANAADPAQKVQVQPGFVEVLCQLTPTDARTLELLYASAGVSHIEPVINDFMVKTLYKGLNLDFNAVSLSIDNLLRLQLCKVSSPLGYVGVPAIIGATAFGFYFMNAVTPPAS